MKCNLTTSRQAEKDYRELLTECYAYASILAMTDLSRSTRNPVTKRRRFTFGQKRAQMFAAALGEIMSGYAEETGEKMFESMRNELKDRKIEIEIKRRR